MGGDKKKKGGDGVGEQQQKGDFAIVPQSVTPALDASNWPLLLRNYDRLNVRLS
jgi:H/ACA ribonucleoprotein complex subunit 4